MKYTIQELKHLRNIRALGFDGSFADDEYGTEKGVLNLKRKSFLIGSKK